MRQRIRKVSRKQVRVSSRDRVFVGCDIHKESLHVTVLVNKRIARQTVMPPTFHALNRLLDPLRPGLQEVAFEAGPTGYSLPRTLQKADYPTLVCAPGKTPRAPNEDPKCDRRDGAKLAECAEKGDLKRIVIPTLQEEADRQVVRMREQTGKKFRRVQQQIKSFMLLYDLRPEMDTANWPKRFVTWLRETPLNPQLRFCLDTLLREYDFLKEQMKSIESQMAQLRKTERHAEAIRLTMTHPGVGPITAMTFRAELYDPERFDGPRQVAAYVGLAPGVRDSGDTQRRMPLAPAGRAELRRLLVQAAWQWVRLDPRANAVYRRLVRNTGCAQKAIIGVARRLAINLWLMTIRHEAYRATAA
jgi:transposase